MAVADMSPAHQDTVGAALKRSQNVMGRHRGGTHNSNGTNIGGVCQSTDTRQISRTVCAPVAHKSDDFRLESLLVHIILLPTGSSV